MGESDVKVKGGSYLKGFKDGIPIGLGYVPISIACGIAACKSGLSFGISQLMSFLLYTASGQAAALNLLNGGETAVAMFALTMFVMNCRYLLLSMSIAQKFDKTMGTWQRIGFGLLNTDEIFGVAMKEKGELGASYLFGLATVPFAGFLLGNALGSFSTGLLPDSISSALGIILFAMFIAIIVPPAKESKPVLVVVLMALAFSVVLECIPVVTQHLTAGWVIIICAIVTSIIGALLFPVEEKEGE